MTMYAFPLLLLFFLIYSICRLQSEVALYYHMLTYYRIYTVIMLIFGLKYWEDVLVAEEYDRFKRYALPHVKLITTWTLLTTNGSDKVFYLLLYTVLDIYVIQLAY